MGLSILPKILEVAEGYGLKKFPRLTNRGETRVCCPFCGDDTKYHCYLNPYQNMFHCFRCGKSGGVAHFIAFYENRSLTEVLKELKEKAGVNRKTVHPAERLTAHQYRLMGFHRKPQFNKLGKEYRKRTLDWVWKTWKAYEKRTLQFAFLYYLYGLYTQSLPKAKLWVEEMEKRRGTKHLWERCERIYQLPRDQWEEWMFRVIDMVTYIIVCDDDDRWAKEVIDFAAHFITYDENDWAKVKKEFKNHDKKVGMVV